MKRLACLAILLVSSAAAADEGMWTFDNFPSASVQERYGFAPDQAWLDHVRLSSARIAGGCSASFVSDSGLVLTNHHCVHGCVAQLSTAEHDLVKDGFLAKSRGEERVCPTAEINQLVDIQDVTAKILEATRGLEGEAYGHAQRAAMSRLEKACSTDRKIRCDLVTLYNGGRYHLYKYRRFQDVRLVFAPELSAASFGGDLDNFDFPRYDLDAAFLRVYEDGEPARIEHFLRWSDRGAQPGELSFTSGHPGRTQRNLSVAELEAQRDQLLPERLLLLSELRGLLLEYQLRGPEERRTALGILTGVENSLKAMKGMRRALIDRDFFAGKVAEEQKLRAWVAADPARVKEYGDAWDRVTAAQEASRRFFPEYFFIESSSRGWGFQSTLFGFASNLVRWSDEKGKPNEERLREFNDANLPALEQGLLSTAPIYPELEKTLLTFSLSKLREGLGADHPFSRLVFGDESARSLATLLIDGSTLQDPKVRKALFDGGPKAIAASKDPMILLVRRIDDYSRRVRSRYEAEVDAPLRQNSERIASARFDAYGTSIYPDATFTLRLSYGSVAGWKEQGATVEPITRLGGMFERATGTEPYALPPRWLEGKGKLALDTPMNFVSTNDIVGGNSGSPVINQAGEVIGLVFDGNLPSLGGTFGFDPAVNRTVAVHSAVILEALEKLYGARALVDELRPPASKAAAKAKQARPAGQ